MCVSKYGHNLLNTVVDRLNKLLYTGTKLLSSISLIMILLANSQFYFTVTF